MFSIRIYSIKLPLFYGALFFCSNFLCSSSVCICIFCLSFLLLFFKAKMNTNFTQKRNKKISSWQLVNIGHIFLLNEQITNCTDDDDDYATKMTATINCVATTPTNATSEQMPRKIYNTYVYTLIFCLKYENFKITNHIPRAHLDVIVRYFYLHNNIYSSFFCHHSRSESKITSTTKLLLNERKRAEKKCITFKINH